MQRDLVGYVAGANLYAYVDSEPVGSFDPFGLAVKSGTPFKPVPKNWIFKQRVVLKTYPYYTDENWVYRHAKDSHAIYTEKVRVPKRCTVIVELSHFGDAAFSAHPWRQDPSMPCSTRFGTLSCWGDYMNEGVPGVIKSSPRQKAPIGPGMGETGIPRRLRPVAGALGFGTAPANYNAGLGRGERAWQKLLANAWAAANAEGRSLLIDPKNPKQGCRREKVTVVFVGESADAKTFAGEYSKDPAHGYVGRVVIYIATESGIEEQWGVPK